MVYSIVENLLKWMIWGYHHLRKHPYLSQRLNLRCPTKFKETKNIALLTLTKLKNVTAFTRYKYSTGFELQKIIHISTLNIKTLVTERYLFGQLFYLSNVLKTRILCNKLRVALPKLSVPERTTCLLQLKGCHLTHFSCIHFLKRKTI